MPHPLAGMGLSRREDKPPNINERKKMNIYHIESELELPSGLEIIACNQIVGDGLGWDCYRNLYQDNDGNRYSLRISSWVERNRKP